MRLIYRLCYLSGDSRYVQCKILPVAKYINIVLRILAQVLSFLSLSRQHDEGFDGINARWMTLRLMILKAGYNNFDELFSNLKYS